MKKFAMAFGLLGILSALGILGVGCSKDACTQYSDDLVAKYNECGITVTTGSSTGTAAACTDTLAKQATCLDACVSKIDCACTKDPTGSGCADKLKPYSDCVVPCLK
jgi:hypothetical protein